MILNLLVKKIVYSLTNTLRKNPNEFMVIQIFRWLIAKNAIVEA